MKSENDYFYNPLLAAGDVPGSENIPEDLLRAMSILIGRNTDENVMPDACADAAALIVLAMKEFSKF